MEFKNTKRGEWKDTEKLGYRVTRSRIKGLPTRYYACVRSVHEDGKKWWNFCQHRRPYKTQAKAQEACEFNRRIWAAAIELGGAKGNRKSRLDTLDQRGRNGGGNVLIWPAQWARAKVDPVLLRMLSPYTKGVTRGNEDDECNDQNAAGETSPSTDTQAQSSQPTLPPGPESQPTEEPVTATKPMPIPKKKSAPRKKTKPKSAPRKKTKAY